MFIVIERKYGVASPMIPGSPISGQGTATGPIWAEAAAMAANTMTTIKTEIIDAAIMLSCLGLRVPSPRETAARGEARHKPSPREKTSWIGENTTRNPDPTNTRNS